MDRNKIYIRVATEEDLEEIELVMKHSMQTLGAHYYSDKQVASCCRYVCVPEKQLIKDKTFFVTCLHKTIIGCGDWSFRKTLYAGPSTPSEEAAILDPKVDPARIRAMFIHPDYNGKGLGSLILSRSEKEATEHGFTKGTLGATLSGLQFYSFKGWQSIAEDNATLPDGVSIRVIRMEKDFLLSKT